MKHTEYARYLRETAGLMGAAAKAANEATPGRWEVIPAYGHSLPSGEWPGAELYDARGLTITSDLSDVEAEYIASWHPLVAASVADLLTSVAIDIEANGEMYALTSTTVARAIKLAQQWRREGAFE